MLSFWSGKPVDGRTCDCHSQPMFFAGSSGYCCFTSVGSENSLQIGTVLVNPCHRVRALVAKDCTVHY